MKKKTSSTSQTSVVTLEKTSKFETIVTGVFAVLTFIAFGFIAIMSLIQTCVFDVEYYEVEKILFNFDNIALNLIAILVFGGILLYLNKVYDFFSKINMKFMYAGLFVYVTALGLFWIFSVWQIPGADSANIFETATEVIKGDYSSLRNGEDFYFSEYYNNISYYNYYPFQLGFVFISEIIYRIFGTENSMPLQFINVICMALSYCCIARITKVIFKRKSVEFFSMILLLGCFQPILFCSFPYGNIIGMTCCIWATYFLIRYFQTEKYIYIIPCGVLLAIGVLAKYNNLIYVAAFAIMLIIHTVSKKKLQSIAVALILCIVSVSASNLVIMSYEKRANVKFESGVSQLLYLGMGLNDTSLTPGWYSGTYMGYYKDNNCNSEIANALAKEDIKMKLEKFTSDGLYTYDFFSKKILSQWNEPTYASIWVSKTKDHIKEPTAFVNSVYDGYTGKFLGFYFNQYMQIVFLLFGVGLIYLLIKKKTNILNIILPLVLLGAFGYHLLFEAKSQYSLVYIILLIPIASYAIQVTLVDNAEKIFNTVSKLKTAHIKTEN